LKVRIVRQPSGSVHGVSLRSYRLGCVYDVPETLAAYLVIQDFAVIEMRTADDPDSAVRERRMPAARGNIRERRKAPRPAVRDRRKKSRRQ
jgi:hypothetical protein